MMHDYNKKVHQWDFQIGDMVLKKTRLNTRNPLDVKLRANWEGLYIISEFKKNEHTSSLDIRARRCPGHGIWRT